ncbi:uncharacterized protein LMH87_008612 [Akanthomyces muscarius]|uniref:ABC transporter n=1 Tax=Akanthomyces muscarius TaxID=2231603 RepID=A0A9W8QH79_AKAMU|nr:uncharacterized protein LMH87_008612 [Akanthomyces muscarius]KAJ4158067.1 hypothetical protein LMH87_008612 [Akanthomyces muscarius]
MPRLAADGHFWDPVLKIFDFSLLFEETIFQLIPSCFAILVSLIFITHHQHEPVYVRSSPLLWAKVVVSSILAGCQANSLAVHAQLPHCRTEITYAASSLELVAAVALCMMIHMEHKHAIRSSAFLALYLFFTVCADAVKSRSYFLRSGMETLGALAATTASLRACLIVLEEVSKKPLLLDDDVRAGSGPEATSGYFQRAFFIYLHPMLMTGFRQNLALQDMGKLGIQFSSKALHLRLKKAFDRTKASKSRCSLVCACIWTWKWELFLMTIPRFANIGACYAQPFLLRLVIDSAEADGNEEGDQITTAMRVGTIAATFLIFMVQAMTTSASRHFANGFVTQVRGGLVAEMMDKTHNLNEKDAKNPSVLTHTSSDIESIAMGLASCVDIPMTFIELGFGVYLLSRFIEQSCFFVLLPVMGSSLFSFLLGLVTGPLMAAWNKSIEVRISKTSQVLRQLPEIKMMGLGPIMRDKIHNLRVEEMCTSRPYRFWMAILNMTTSLTDVGTPVIVMAAAYFWKGFGHRMSASQVFPTLAIVSLIQNPTVKSLQVYTELTGMVACFDRVQKFLELPERKDSRVKRDPSAPPESYELVPTHYDPTEMRPWPVARSAGGIIQFSNASFGAFGLDNPLLTEVKFALFRGSVTGVLGNTGCGKSTFLKSILGETKNSNGFVYTDQVTIAYCSANIWLKDTTIRDNIIGCLPFDPVRYDLAIRSCQLEQDLSRLPGRDNYIVGTDGASLSGGQRQRVALARAVFAHCEITIIDGCFGSLDRETAVAILYDLCGENGVLRSAGSTVLLATYLPESLHVIDQMITVDDEGHVMLDEEFASDASHARLMTRLLSGVTSNMPQEVEDKESASINRSWPSSSPSGSFKDGGLRSQGGWRLYMLFINSVGKLRFTSLNLLAFIMAASELIPEIYLRIWTDLAPEDGSWFGCQDANLFAKVLPFYFYRTMYMLYSVLILIGIILSSATYMCALLPVIFLSIYFIQRFYLRTSRQMRHLDLEEKAPLYTYLNETAAGVSYIQAFGWVEKNLEKGYQLLDNSQQPYYLMLCIQQWLGLVLGILTTIIAVTLVSIVLFSKNGTSPSAVGLSFLSLLNIQRTLVCLIEAWTGSETSVACLARLKEFKETTPQEPRPASPEQLPSSWPSEGSVELTGVSSWYKPAVDMPPIVRDASLLVDGGEKIGLFGRTGSGKSSLLLTLLGLLSYEGIVEIDGVDIANIDPDALRAHMITITQHPIQFDDTIRANLLPFEMNSNRGKITDEQKIQRDAKDAILIGLLDRFRLWSKVRDRGGLDAMLTDVGYSKGEIQLLSIARAIVRRRDTGSNLVLVDEATSNLDPERDAETQAIMDEAFAGCTVFTVAHRLETIQNVDCKIEMAEGTLTQSIHSRRAIQRASRSSSN